MKTTMKVPFVDLNAQYRSMKGEIDAALKRVIRHSSFILGQEVEEFERAFAEYCGARYCLGVNSGTAALHLALTAAGIGRGDEVVTQPNTFFATAEAISHSGAKPVFADIDRATYGLDAHRTEVALSSKTRCLLPVHLYGNAADLETLLEISEQHGLVVIEDACQALGVSHAGKRLGTFGAVGCFSFYPGKVLGSFGEGGAVITDNEEIYNTMKMLRDHGQAQRHDHRLIGYNYRMEGLQGAVLRAKLKRLDAWIALRRERAKLYNRLLADTGVRTPKDEIIDRSNIQYYVIGCAKRDQLRDYLAQQGIASMIHYPTPIHLQPAYAWLGCGEGSFPVAETTAKEILSLPMYPELEERQIVSIVDRIREFYRDDSHQGFPRAI